MEKTPVPWRKLYFYDSVETGGTTATGIELMEDACPEGGPHDFHGIIPESVLSGREKPVGVTCKKCGRELDPEGPNGPPVERPEYVGSGVLTTE